MVLPLSMMSLVRNIKFQIASVMILLFIMSVWIFIFAQNGLNLPIPIVHSNQGSLLGFTLSNFAFVSVMSGGLFAKI